MFTKYAKLAMKKNTENRCALIQMSSILTDIKLPFTAIYSATKRYDQRFGRLIDKQNRWSPSAAHIDTLIVKPSTTTTAMTEYKKDPSAVMPDAVPKGVFRELGIRTETFGAFSH
jgi:short-subunit dehydrogenase